MQEDSANSERLLRRAEASALLIEHGFKISTQTLAKYATIGGGPEFEMWSRFPMYRPSKLLEWARGRLSKPMRSTADRQANVA